MGIFQQFPYSNFHEMNLDQIIKIMRQMQDEWEDTKAEWASYKDFIDNYFENLDVSEEVLEAMRIFVEDGTLNRIMDPVIVSETGDWLTAHITNPSSPPLDSTLSIASAAAPADVVGRLCSPYKYSINLNYGDSADLDDITTPGVYLGTSPNTYVNVPNFIRFSFLLEVWQQSANVIMQRISSIEYGISAMRMLSGGSWTKWGVSTGTFTINQANATNIFGGVAGNLPANTTVFVNTSWFSDSPSDLVNKEVYITTHAVKEPHSNVAAMQMLVHPQTSYIYTREQNSSGVWQSWHTTSSMYNIVDKGSLTAIYGATVDVDTVQTIGVYYVASPNTVVNLPSANMGELEVNRGSTGVWMQKFTDYRTGRVYVRWYHNTWTDWIADTPHASAGGKYYAYGDSLVQGQIAVTGDTSPNNYPQAVGRLTGVEVVNNAVRNQGLIKDNAAILTAINSADLSDAGLITVGWAYNDSAYYASTPFGSAASIDNTSYIGHYFTVMKTLQEKAPQANIILVTGYGYETPVNNQATLADQFTHSFTFNDGSHTVKEMYDTLEAMCYKNGWLCVNQAKGCSLNKFNAATMIGDQIHPTAEGYVTYSNSIAARIAALYGNI